MVAGKVIACERRVTYYETVVKPGNERRCDMLQLLDKVEEKHLASDATVVPGGMAMGQREAMKHVGMVPRNWRDCGVSENHIRRSFNEETASLLGIRRNA